MENILVSKIIEAESNAEKIISDSKEQANKLLEDYKVLYSQEKKQIEEKYDELLLSMQKSLKEDFEKDFNQKLEKKKIEIKDLKSKYQQNYDKALNILLSGVDENVNS